MQSRSTPKDEYKADPKQAASIALSARMKGKTPAEAAREASAVLQNSSQELLNKLEIFLARRWRNKNGNNLLALQEGLEDLIESARPGSS